MHRRSLVALAVGFVGLVAISPVFATDSAPSPSPPSDMSSSSSSSTTMSSSVGSSSSSSTTMPSSAASSSSSTSSTTTTSSMGSPTPSTTSKAPPSSSQVCTPVTDQSAAPAEGGPSETYPAGEAGDVEVKRASPTDLSIVQATEKTGWTHQITGETGPRVKVKFTNSAGPPWVVRFAASLDQSGQEIHIRVTTCK